MGTNRDVLTDVRYYRKQCNVRGVYRMSGCNVPEQMGLGV